MRVFFNLPFFGLGSQKTFYNKSPVSPPLVKMKWRIDYKDKVPNQVETNHTHKYDSPTFHGHGGRSSFQ